MEFAESVKYLYSLGNEVSTMKLGLENIRKLLAALGNPQNNYLKIQVAGTNGKGSVCAFLDAICLSAGIKTGLFTSPHLVSITERIRIGGFEISESEFARLATLIRQTAERMVDRGELEYRPTFFEQVTGIALAAFAEAKVELAILETGLGGRLDATTAANAEIAVITRIDYDHQEYLGDSLAEIAAEKAAIIRETSTVIAGKQTATALNVILERCREVDITPNFEIYEPWTVTPIAPAAVRVEMTRQIFPSVTLGLRGRHQAENAETAINVVQSLSREFGVAVDANEIINGLEIARHSGRLEYHGRYLFDGAHNIGGTTALAAYLEECEKRMITLVFGAMRDKDVAEIAEILFPMADKLILTRADNSRAMNAGDILAILPGNIDRSKISITDTVDQALALATELVAPDGLILIAGSLYLIGEAKQILNQNLKSEI